MNESTKTLGYYTITEPVVIAFPNLLEAKAVMVNGKPKGDPIYSANLVIAADHPDLKPLKEQATAVARNYWPDKPLSEIVFPFANGDRLADESKAKEKDGEYQRGKVVLKTKSKYEPRLSYLENGKIIDLENDAAKNLAKNKFYNGVEALVQVNFVAAGPIGPDKKCYITAYLNMVLSTGKGTRLSGGATASEVFKGYTGTISTESVVGDSLDDIIG